MGQRMFVAVLPPADAVEHLAEFLEPRLDVGRTSGLRWSAPEHWHLTLAFAPAVPDHAHDELVEGLARAAARRRGFETRLAGGGAFPDVARAKVVYAGLELGFEARTELDRLATGVRAAAGSAGVAVDGQRFRPHVTLARLNRPAEVTRWIRLFDAYAGPAWPVTAVSLVASHLGEGPHRRPRYEVLEEFPLAREAPNSA